MFLENAIKWGSQAQNSIILLIEAIGTLQEQIQGARQQENDKTWEMHKSKAFL